MGHTAHPPVAATTYDPGKQSEHTVLPLALVDLPALHWVHANCSVSSVKKPIGHWAHPFEAATTYDPGKQSEHTVLPLALVDLPALHGVHTNCSVSPVKKPIGHWAHPFEAATTYDPGKQREHTVIPSSELRPSAQASHAFGLAWAPENIPGSHLLQPVRPVEACQSPGLHGRQEADAFAGW